jgi:hypothetical protein
LTSSGDFGTAARPGFNGWPALFCEEENLGGGDAVATSAVVPDGETWLVTGFGFWSQCSGPCSVWGVLFSGVSIVLAGRVINVDNFGLGDLETSPGAGDVLLGAWPYMTGQRIEVQCHATASSTNCSASAWGIVLPYPTSAP